MAAREREVAERVYRYCFPEYCVEGTPLHEADVEELDALLKAKEPT